MIERLCAWQQLGNGCYYIKQHVDSNSAGDMLLRLNVIAAVLIQHSQGQQNYLDNRENAFTQQSCLLPSHTVNHNTTLTRLLHVVFLLLRRLLYMGVHIYNSSVH